MGRKSEQTLNKMTNKHMERWSKLLCAKETQIKATMKHYCLPRKMAKMKRSAVPRVGEGVEHPEFSCFTGGEIKQHNHVSHKALHRDVHSGFIHNGQ